ncbi:MAG TPA: hypothetical protein VFB72_12460, partial [Verrucomicrobiae bacterium]|nr:hypothetical protein [Verrucomicrobiae bacterium]
PPEVGPGFIEALRQGSVQSLAALFTSPQNPWPPNTSVALNYCPQLKAGQSKDCDLYLSIKQVIAPGKGGVGDAFDQSKGKMLANHILVNRQEIAALLPRFTSLETVAGTTATEALKDLQVELKPAVPAHALAEVTPVEPAYAGKVLTTKVGLVVTALSLISILGVFVPIGMAALGVYLGFPDHPPAGGVSMGTKIIGAVLLGLAALIFVTNMVVLFTIPDYLGRRYMSNLIQREFCRRPKPLVSPTDSDVRLVQVIPRNNWGSVKLFDCTDIGFLRVDKQRRELLFEGDKQYYRVPAEAIKSCQIETFTYGQGTAGATTLYHVVMHATHPSGIWEVPLSQRGNIGKFRRKSRQKWALELQAEIRELMSSANLETSVV